MNGWHLFLLVAHSLVCLLIVTLSAELMRRRNSGHLLDLVTWAYYGVGVGACIYLAEPFRSELPTFADLVFESSVALYMVVKISGHSPRLAAHSQAHHSGHGDSEPP